MTPKKYEKRERRKMYSEDRKRKLTIMPGDIIDIYLDMDGVTFDWHAEVARIAYGPHSSKRVINNSTWPEDYKWGDAYKYYGYKNEREMWNEINKVPTFWRDIPICRHTESLCEVLGQFAAGILEMGNYAGIPDDKRVHVEIGFATWPTLGTCSSHKFEVLTRTVPASAEFADIMPYFDSSIHITKAKHKLADRTSILIDDSDDNCEKFEERGGFAIVFPQPWNSKRDYSASPVHFVKGELISIVNYNVN